MGLGAGSGRDGLGDGAGAIMTGTLDRGTVTRRGEQADLLADLIADRVADEIIAGSLQPGSRLDEQTLAERFGTSRTPVREAIRQLKASGLIDVRPRRGAVVATVTKEELDILFVAMGEIEATCARLSALGMTPVERRRLQSVHEEMRAFVDRDDHAAYAEANVDFHTRIYAGAHNPVIADIALGLRRRLAPFRNAQLRAPGRLARSHAEHEAVISAIVAGNATAAHSTMLHHVSLVEDTFERFSASARDGAGPARRIVRVRPGVENGE